MLSGINWSAQIRCVFATLFLLVFAHQGCCCDTSMLELLTGSSSQESVNAKLLIISSKMQVTAATAQAFNHAAAEKMHHEVMESWLYVASQITTNPPGQASGKSGFNSLIVEISRELGNIRQQIARRELEDVHDRLEVCVTRMSLLAAMIDGNHRMSDFLRLELVVLGLRPVARLFEQGREALLTSDLPTMLADLQLTGSQLVIDKIAVLRELAVALRNSVQSDQKRFATATLTGYLLLYQEFAALKRLLLAEKYFQS